MFLAGALLLVHVHRGSEFSSTFHLSQETFFYVSHSYFLPRNTLVCDYLLEALYTAFFCVHDGKPKFFMNFSLNILDVNIVK